MRKPEARNRRINRPHSSYRFKQQLFHALVLLLLTLGTCIGFSTKQTVYHSYLFKLNSMSKNPSVAFGDVSALESNRSSGDDPRHEQTANSGGANVDKNTSQAEAAVDFARLLGRLKVTPRTGWVRRGVPKWESVADHSWRVAALSLLLPNDFDLTKCIAMGVLHDVAESLTGDICPDDNVSKEDKARMEAEAVEKITMLLGKASRETDIDSNNSTAQQLLSLLHEYEERESKEAIGVKDLDLLDMIIQAGEYEERFGLDLSEFYDGTPVSRFRTPAIQEIAHEVHDQRKTRIESQVNDDNKDGDCVSKRDAAFVAEFSASSNMSSEEVKQVVKAMRAWDDKKNND